MKITGSEEEIKAIAKLRFQNEIHPLSRYSPPEKLWRLEEAMKYSSQVVNPRLSTLQKLHILNAGFDVFPYLDLIIARRAVLFEELGNYSDALNDALALVHFWDEGYDIVRRLINK